jgi:hypothetical protein
MDASGVSSTAATPPSLHEHRREGPASPARVLAAHLAPDGMVEAFLITRRRIGDAQLMKRHLYSRLPTLLGALIFPAVLSNGRSAG